MALAAEWQTQRSRIAEQGDAVMKRMLKALDACWQHAA
jgi:hypothetical protein